MLAQLAFGFAVLSSFGIPNANVAIDPSGSATRTTAERLPFVPAASFRYRGGASLFRPLVVWVRFPAPRREPAYVVTAPDVGRATLYSPMADGQYAVAGFGMRQPFVARALARVRPTVELPAGIDSSRPLYLRLALDDEPRSHLLAAVLDERELAQQDARLQHLASIALLFIGIFISLAAANLFVFFFVRERSYVIYSGMMLSNAVFAGAYLHQSAWAWFWPFLSLPYEAAMAWIIVVESVLLLGFARSFLKTRRIVPRTDAVITGSCVVLIAGGLLMGFLFPGMSFGPVDGRAAFLLAMILVTMLVFALGIAALRAGNRYARFFVASNGVVTLAAIVLAATDFTRRAPNASSDFLLLMIGQAVEGWLLFGALAYRLRETIGAHLDEQQQRLLAQAEALAHARALLESRQQASTDALTGIANRRAFDEMLEREWDRCARRGSPLSLLILDVDLFKKFNDAYGHVAGDECLKRVAQAIASCATRPTDVCARYGGEEFAAILGDTDAAGARAIANEVVRAVTALRIRHRESPHAFVSVSVGAATVVPKPGSALSIVERADGALYRAKENGRNRVESEEPASV